MAPCERTTFNLSSSHPSSSYSPSSINPKDEAQHHQRRIKQFFIFICLSIAIRSFEAGIISSMMPSIQSSLHFDYTTEGMIAASPDYGIAPGGLIAIYIFQLFRHDVRKVLIFITFGTAFATFVCALQPSVSTLVFSRAVGGLLWSHAATLYPAWIDKHGPTAELRTLWLSGINVSLMAGILTGFVVGGVVRTTASLHMSWVTLYYLEGFLMLACGVILVLYFDRDLIQIYDDEEEDENEASEESDNKQDEETPSEQSNDTNNSNGDPALWELFCSLLGSFPFVFAVMLSALIVGCTGFALYFVTQVCEARGLTPSQSVSVVSMVFVSSPGPGNILGAWLVGKLGGYNNHVSTFGFAFATGIVALLSSLFFWLSRVFWADSDGGGAVSVSVFVCACWLFFFTGGSSTAPLAGVAVSAVPNASHVASGLQFSIQNAAKIVVPQIGGYVVDRMGLLRGFDYTVIGCCVAYCVLGIIALMHMVHVRNKTLPTRRHEYAQLE